MKEKFFLNFKRKFYFIFLLSLLPHKIFRIFENLHFLFVRNYNNQPLYLSTEYEREERLGEKRDQLHSLASRGNYSQEVKITISNLFT